MEGEERHVLSNLVGIVSLASEVGAEKVEAKSLGAAHGEPVLVLALALRTDVATALNIKINVKIDIGHLVKRPGNLVTVEEPALANLRLHGLRLPDVHDETTLLSARADVDL